MAKGSSLIGDYKFHRPVFSRIDEAFKEFYQEDFKKLNDRKRSNFVNKSLLNLIQEQREPCFLLSSVLDFIERVDREDVLHHYTFTSFELWLNQYSGLNFEENYLVRAKIVGKNIPREDYQVLFPIGMGKVYEGTHFVTAHKSPDLDTTVASFWGWVDAFGAKVSDGLHIWNVPGGPPPSQIEIDLIFRDIFGSAIFSHLVKTRNTLSLSGNDMMTQKGMIKKKVEDLVTKLDYERSQNAIVVTDTDGFYLGDWRSMDVETIRQIISLLNNCLRFFENNIHVRLISLFTKDKVSMANALEFISEVFKKKIDESEPTLEYTVKQKEYLDTYLRNILGVKQGLKATYAEFGKALSSHSLVNFSAMKDILSSIDKAKVFDNKGNLIEDRPRLFFYLEKTIKQIHQTIQNVRTYMEQLGVALKIKSDVLGFVPQFITVRSDVEEMRSKMESYQHLTVVYPDGDKWYPVGVVQALSLRKKTLGTVSLRDFCNPEEMQIPSYLDVISVIDHHKSTLNTSMAPLAIISDAQSSNSLVAEQAFLINDKHSNLGLDEKQIDEQIAKEKDFSIMQRLLNRKLIVKKEDGYYVHSERELLEYLHFLYAILDDTDLMTKVSKRDIECVCSLLNRMKSIILKKEVEIINFDDIERDKNFVKLAAKKILQNEDMYSIYQKVYAFREKEVEKNMDLCSLGKACNLFADTKEQNGCCRVGQTKLFAKNIPFFHQRTVSLRDNWVKRAEEVTKLRSEIDLHMQMISTIVSAQEVYKGGQEIYHHKDELWIWIAPTDLAIEHLKRFLNAFRESPHIGKEDLEVEFFGDNSDLLSQAFSESFIDITHKKMGKGPSMAVLYYKAGVLNSRKAMISPYLPSIVS